jgi:CRISPR-associated protein Cas1
LTASGLHCAIGLHHHNRYNAFALADDMIEPYRPFVDRTVCELVKNNPGTSLTKEQKARLLETLTVDVFLNEQRKPLLLGVSHSTSSLVKCLKGDENQLLCPTMK